MWVLTALFLAILGNFYEKDKLSLYLSEFASREEMKKLYRGRLSLPENCLIHLEIPGLKSKI